MEYLINLCRDLNNTDRERMKELKISLIYESKFLSCVGVIADSDEILKCLDFVESVQVPIEGEYQDGEFASSIAFQPPIRRSILVKSDLVGWGDTRIAVLDSGVNPDVNVVDSKDFTNSGIADRKGHGNNVAKIIKYFAKGSSLYVAKIGEHRPNELYLMNAIEWAVDNGAQIINISAGFNRQCNSNCKLCKLVDIVSNLGVAIIVAAGNNDNKVGSIACPGHAMNALTVGAIDKDNKIADYSSFGKEGKGKPNIVAPGNVYVDGNYITGTSFSAPLVSGVIGAILNRVGNIPKAIEYIYTTTIDLGYPAHQQGLGAISINKIVEAIENEEADIRSTEQNRSS
ncbi:MULTISPECIES: S8 family peptidase [Bacillus]|uniref:S8 family peptidase n=1 Tax=Bacillus TaxID=1386 RepID=UPI0002DD4202|nr:MULTISPECIES: S8 family serine peptidase [Bacillus]